jgi:hypothetical protein
MYHFAFLVKKENRGLVIEQQPSLNCELVFFRSCEERN